MPRKKPKAKALPRRTSTLHLILFLNAQRQSISDVLRTETLLLNDTIFQTQSIVREQHRLWRLLSQRENKAQLKYGYG